MAPEEFARRAGLAFRDPELLWRALTHRSYLNEHTDALEDNERLEFLGDAALDFLSAAWLYRRFPEMDEGKLTRLRSALVRTEQLAIFARELGLGEALAPRARGGGLRRADAGGAAVRGLRSRARRAVSRPGHSRPWRHSSSRGSRRRRKPSWMKTRKSIPRSLLQIWAQAERGETPRYRTVGARGPDHAREFVVEVTVGAEAMGRGEGRSKQEAAHQAAADALARIQPAAGVED